MNLAAGTFVVTAKVVANNNDAAVRAVSCSLLLGTTTIDDLFDDGLDMGATANDDRAVATLTGAATLAAAGTASVVCRTNSPSGNWLARSITAIQVAKLNGT
ncbi:MAG: hypothetical protein ABR583_13070 [Gaiellaceae bacterium]